MSLTPTELKRIEAIEASINALQTALNNLATKKELKNLFAVLDQLVRDIQASVAQIRNVSAAALLDAHNVSDDHPQYHTDARAYTWLGTRSTTDLPEGSNYYFTADRAIAALTTSGVLNHNLLGGLGNDDHTQYVRTDGTREITTPFNIQGHLTVSGVNISSTIDELEAALTTILG